MLETERNPCLVKIQNKEFRGMVEESVRSGLLRKLVQLIGPVPGDPGGSGGPPFEPRLEPEEVEGEIRFIREEALAQGVDISERVIQLMVLMRQVQLPTRNRELGLALSRAWALGLHSDTLCEHDPAVSYCILKHGAGVAQPPSAFADYIDFTFSELARFCDPEFLAVYKTFFHQTFLGTLFEAEVLRTGSQHRVRSVRYIREKNGYSEFWYSSLQFLDDSVGFTRHMMFWVDTLESGMNYIGQLNDVFSIYKEAMAGDDFGTSYIFRRSVMEKVPYLQVFQETVETVAKAYHDILRSAASGPPEMRGHVETYLRGYACWHFRSSRYHWRDVFPEMQYLEDDLPRRRSTRFARGG